jgi:putative intracellular protease/amidase
MLSLIALTLASISATPVANQETKPMSDPSKLLIVLTSHASKGSTGAPTGYYLSEVTHPLALFEKAGLKVEFASIQGGKPPVDGLNLDDAINAKYWNDAAFQTAISTTAKLSEVDPKRYAAVFFAGGHGTMWDFADSRAVQQVTRAIYEAGGVVGAVCHGPAALVNVRLSNGDYLVKGRRVAAFTDSEEKAVGLSEVVPFLLASTLEKRGATHVPAANWQAQVVTDGRLVTGQNPASAHGVGEAMIKALAESKQSARH